MNFPSIEIQGNIISSEILSTIRTEQATYQQGRDFNPNFTNSKLKDEISFAWQEAKGQWIIFQSKIARLDPNKTGTTETRNFWMQPLLTNLGYNLSFSKSAVEVNGKYFQIGFKDNDLDGFPVYIGSCFDSLDKPPHNKQHKTSSHAMLQEYLNYDEAQLYGLVTNGKQIRLLRDATRITRLSYVEFNLEKIMEEDLYSDFVIFYRLLHSSRMKKQAALPEERIIEKYHQESLAAGSTIRNKLGFAVKESIEKLGQEFINHPLNTAFRQAVNEGKVNIDEYYRHQLRIIYRLLFLFVIEERNLVFGNNKSPELKRFNRIYFDYYSLLRLRKIAKNHLPPDSNRNYDLWLGLLNTFAIFEKKEIGEKLGIMSLEGDLFSYDAITSSSYDLHKCYLSNATLLKIIKSLTYFENENKVLIPVNYGGLDVEEFGSVYEGLLELKLAIKKIDGSDDFICNFESSSERGKSGSHYTPEELVQPLIKHSLEYLIEERVQPYYQKKAEKEATLELLLKLKVCDVACGSGHILLSGARRISLEYARIETGEEQPNPSAIRRAMKKVVRNCIYGVDKNPLAVELCKVALWLEAYNPGEPLSFLDHHIKCGDSIVGLARREELERGIANEAFKKLPGDDAEVVKYLTKKNKDESHGKENFFDTNELLTNINQISTKYREFDLLPEKTLEDVKKKAKQYNVLKGSDWWRLKEAADVQVAQFFLPKTKDYQSKLTTFADYFRILGGEKGKHERQIAGAMAVGIEKRFFHWFLEFPDVFAEGGFDCILGNPPFLGGKRISGNYGDEYLNYIKTNYYPAEGSVDLVVYFFRRIFDIVKYGGIQALISTNTLSQGDSRISGLEQIIRNKGKLIFAIKSVKWPGQAAVEVSLVSISKAERFKSVFLNGKLVEFISSFLDDSAQVENPKQLFVNQNKSFQGSVVLGTGFILDEIEKNRLIQINPKNKEVIFPYLNGDDINTDPNQKPSRWIINFFDWSKEYCSTNYPECFGIVGEKVKPERNILDDKGYREKWWQYGRRAVDLYKAIEKLKRVLVVAQTGKTAAISFAPNGYVFSMMCIVFSLDYWDHFAFLQSSLHESWAWKYCSTMGSSTLRYTPTNAFQTFPFSQIITIGTRLEIEKKGEQYHEFRKQLMLNLQLGLTKTYNLFHTPQLTKSNLQLIKAKLQIPIEQAVKDIESLRELHKQMDEAVLKAYGWTDINLAHNFYEVDYLPENDRVRYTISPDARKEILKRLLELNHKIHEEEVAAGLWEKKKSTPKKKEKTSTPNSSGFFD
jgi:methylase of polypeptide subunit release factors